MAAAASSSFTKIPLPSHIQIILPTSTTLDEVDERCSNCIFIEETRLQSKAARLAQPSITWPTCGHTMCVRCVDVLVNISNPGEYVSISCNVCWLVYTVQRKGKSKEFNVRPCDSIMATTWYDLSPGEIETAEPYEFSPLCDICLLVPSQHFCRQDHLKFCSRCWLDFHANDDDDDDQHEPFSTYSDQFRMCKLHKGKPMIYRCSSHDCLRFGCALCVETPEHRDHRKQAVHHLFTHMHTQLINYFEVADVLVQAILRMKSRHDIAEKSRKTSYDKRLTTFKAQCDHSIRTEDTDVSETIKTFNALKSKHDKLYDGHTAFRKIRFRASLIVYSLLVTFLQKVNDLRATLNDNTDIYTFISRAHQLLQQGHPNRWRVYSDSFAVMPCDNPSTESHDHHCHRLAYLHDDAYYTLRPSEQGRIACSPLELAFKCYQTEDDTTFRFYLAIASRMLKPAKGASYQCTLDVAVCHLDEDRRTIIAIHEEAAIFVVLTSQVPMAFIPIWVSTAEFSFDRVELHFRLSQCTINKY